MLRRTSGNNDARASALIHSLRPRSDVFRSRKTRTAKFGRIPSAARALENWARKIEGRIARGRGRMLSRREFLRGGGETFVGPFEWLIFD